jgi:hypothetical protein
MCDIDGGDDDDEVSGPTDDGLTEELEGVHVREWLALARKQLLSSR